MSALTNWTNSGRGNVALYLPMKDADTAGVNEAGTGDFTGNGVLDTAQRGANQWNCVASEFDGVDDYLSSVNIGAVDSQSAIFSFTIKHDDSKGDPSIFTMAGSYLRSISIDRGQKKLRVNLSSSSFRLSINLNPNFDASVQLYVDSINQSNCLAIVNGKTQLITWDAFAPSTIDFTHASYWIGRGEYDYLSGAVGEFYFDLPPAYIDLATDNPFWNSTLNKPKPVRQVLEETGNTPLIAMPISADNPTLNLGTGGNFTLNGGGLTGARGASEYIARGAYQDLNTISGSNLKRTSISGLTASESAFSLVFCASPKDTATTSYEALFAIGDRYETSALRQFVVTAEGTENLRLWVDTGVVTGQVVDAFINKSFVILINYDGANIRCEVVGDSFSGSFTTALTKTFDMTKPFWFFGFENTQNYSGSLQSCYFINQNIDFSQEANRNLFVDQLGYPKDLSKQIADGLIPQPLFYLPFDDPDDLGKDASGNDNHFVINGTVTQGSDFSL